MSEERGQKDMDKEPRSQDVCEEREENCPTRGHLQGLYAARRRGIRQPSMEKATGGKCVQGITGLLLFSETGIPEEG